LDVGWFRRVRRRHRTLQECHLQRPKLRHGLLPRRRELRRVPDRLEQTAGHREPVLMPKGLPPQG